MYWIMTMAVYTNRDAQTLTTGEEVGRGGEGVVYAVVERADVVAKIYHPAQRTHHRHAKVTAMLAQPPLDSGRAFVPPHVSLAWPTDLLFEEGAFVGFLMPRIERSPNLVALFNPLLRRQRYPHADRRFLYRTGQNLAAVLATLHSRGHVVGDLNQKNILVKANALVTLVDTDSFQIGDGNGHCYRCPVGVPDYTPPELQGQPLADLERQPYHDCFGLSVLLFQLLMEGYHPFTGRPLTTTLSTVEQLSLHCMQQGWFPYSNNSAVQPPPDAPPFTWLPPELRRLFLQSFLVGYTQPTQRPTAATWAQALAHAEVNLVRCPRRPEHWYSNHLARCPVCLREPKVMPVSQPVGQASNKPVAAAQPTYTGLPGCVLSLLKLGGVLYLLFFMLMLLLNGYWPILVGLLVLAARLPQIRHNIAPLTTHCCRWLVANSRQLGQGTLVTYRWLAPRVWRAGQISVAYWRGSPLLVKELTAIGLLIVVLVAMSYVGAPSSAGSQPPPSPLIVSPTVVQQPMPTAPLIASPLVLPTVTAHGR